MILIEDMIQPSTNHPITAHQSTISGYLIMIEPTIASGIQRVIGGEWFWTVHHAHEQACEWWRGQGNGWIWHVDRGSGMIHKHDLRKLSVTNQMVISIVFPQNDSSNDLTNGNITLMLIFMAHQLLIAFAFNFCRRESRFAAADWHPEWQAVSTHGPGQDHEIENQPFQMERKLSHTTTESSHDWTDCGPRQPIALFATLIFRPRSCSTTPGIRSTNKTQIYFSPAYPAFVMALVLQVEHSHLHVCRF